MSMTGTQERLGPESRDAVADLRASINSAAVVPFRDSAELESAFREFSEISEKLTTSYRVLEQRVATLSGELASVSAQRMRELAEKERLADRLENLLNLLPGGVVVLDGRGYVQECNPAAIDLLGEPLRGEKWLDIISRSFSPRGDDGHEVSLRDGRRVSLATGSLGATPGQIILLTDQTETRKLQQALSRHERLSSMGRMVASLAHQVRTPLSAALIYSTHLCSENLSDEQRVKFAGKVKSRLEHLEQQVRDMLLFARGETRLTETVSIDELLGGVATAVESAIHQAAAGFTVRNHAGNAQLLCNRETLIGALVNLVENGLHACGDDARILLDADLEAGTHVAVRVTDNGPGMDAEELQRVREPFYTTKPQGTGLGLAVVQAVARSHHGQLRLSSTPGRGTRASLVLPLQRQGSNDNE